MTKTLHAGPVPVGGRHPLVIIAGPCIIESRRHSLALATRLAALARRQGVPLIFKASYDKANRTSVAAYRGPGLVAGLDILREVKERLGCNCRRFSAGRRTWCWRSAVAAGL